MTAIQSTIVLDYKAQTKHIFPLAETVAVAKLLVQGVDRADVRRQVLEEDLFELRSPASRAGALQMIWRRLDKFPLEYSELLANGNSDTKRFTLLFIILCEHRLLREFIAEVLVEKLRGLSLTVTTTDLRAFFETKREQEATLAEWSEATFKKAASNTLLLLVRSGLLQPLIGDSKEDKRGCYEIRAVPPPAALRQQLVLDGYEKYLALMLDRRLLE
ncbi:MAG: BrxA family protein [Cyanobacteria bacterium J06627_28]